MVWSLLVEVTDPLRIVDPVITLSTVMTSVLVLFSPRVLSTPATKVSIPVRKVEGSVSMTNVN